MKNRQFEPAESHRTNWAFHDVEAWVKRKIAHAPLGNFWDKTCIECSDRARSCNFTIRAG